MIAKPDSMNNLNNVNISFDDQNSQSTNDHPSETSSANIASPHLSTVYSASRRISKASQRLFPQREALMYPSNNYHPQELRHMTSPQKPHGLSNQPTRRSYTGVDRLIMAAMIEESAAAASASGYLPSGRGIGYFASSQNVYSHIPQPSSKSELELYRLLESANLLNYFGTFLNFGGDDVQQLSDADEEEFLEIMSLVGMTQKPLHVRRLQKALFEWRDNKELENTFRRPPQIGLIHSNNQNNISTQAVNESPAPRSSMSRCSIVSETSYVNPHEAFVGAPKRLKLMDDYHRKKLIQASNRRSNDHDSSVDLSTSKLPGKDDEDDDKFIEIMDNSSQSDTDHNV